MSTRVSGPQSPIIESRDELVAYLEAGSKPESDWSIGTEHEKFGFNIKDHSPVPYLGAHGIGALLKAHHERFGWEPILENGNIIALSCLDCPKGGSISLEPGGQLELVGRAAGDHPRDRGGAAPASHAGGRGRRRARHRVPRPRLLAQMDAG